jgi:hypothetical protein
MPKYLYTFFYCGFNMKKRGEGLTFNVIIVAALGLIVLVILAYILGSKMNIFHQSTLCSARNGVCRASQNLEGCPADKIISITTEDCPLVENNENTHKFPGQCCIPIG